MGVIARLEVGEDLIYKAGTETAKFADTSQSSSAGLARSLALEDSGAYNVLTVGVAGNGFEEALNPRSAGSDSALGRVAVIEPRVFLRECIRRGMRTKFDLGFDTFASIDEFEQDLLDAPVELILLSCSGSSELETVDGRTGLKRLSVLAPRTPIVVLASRQDPELMRVAMAGGAKGYIPMSMGFDLAVEAVRFVLAGGTYVPAELLFAAAATGSFARRVVDRPAMTSRELLVTRAIQQGKPNKVIAYELNMCESTVKVHVRHIMKKLGAKNRTDLAMKSKEFTNDMTKGR